MTSVTVVDNHDSFTDNLVQYLAELGAKPVVHRNDEVRVERLAHDDALVVSPGSGTPAASGVSTRGRARADGRLPVLGACLGHQYIGEAFGGTVLRGRARHDKVSRIHHDGSGILVGLPQPFEATRYQSLVVERDSLPPELAVTAWANDDEVMGLRRRQHPTFGVQFHLESVLTPEGMRMLRSFLEAAQ